MNEPRADQTESPKPTPRTVPIARIVAAVAALVALVASGMLIAPYLVGAGFCAPGAGCDVVARSSYGHLFGVPVAFLGAFAFTAGLAIVVSPGPLPKRLAPWVGASAIVGALRFLFLQKFVIGAWCVFCVAVDSASIVFGAALLFEWYSLRAHTAPRHALSPTPLAIAAVLAISLPVIAATRRPQEPPVRTLEASVGRDQDGRLILREFIDLECPYCRATQRVLHAKLAARPDIVVQRHHVPLASHRYAKDAAIAACCAAEQGAEERFVEAVVEVDVEPAAPFCRAVVDKLGLDLAKYDACVASDRPSQRIAVDRALLDKTGFVGLPTIDLEGERWLGMLNDAQADAFLARHR